MTTCQDISQDKLTNREQNVLKLLAEGLSNAEIADRLAITRKTVESHITHIFSKLSIRTRTQAAYYASSHSIRNKDQSSEISVSISSQNQISARNIAITKLTNREQSIFNDLRDPKVADLTTKQLAQRWGIAQTTVKKHLQHIYNKLDVQSRAAAIALSAYIITTNQSEHIEVLSEETNDE